jgi:uncharacterized integral membrane protein (TIGR00697 family)
MPNQKEIIPFGENKNIKFKMSQVNCLVFLSILYVSIMICNAVLTTKWISLGNDLFVFGGAFISPLLFILGDIIAEIYGYKLSRHVILSGFIGQTVFAILAEIMIRTPAPPQWHEYHSFAFVIGPILRIDLSGFIAFFLSSLLNAYFITKWKVIVHGRYFWLRSIGASTFSEALYSMFAIMMIGFGNLPFQTMFKIIVLTYLIKLGYSLILAFPGNILTNYLKKAFKVDIYDTVKTPTNLLKYLQKLDHA